MTFKRLLLLLAFASYSLFAEDSEEEAEPELDEDGNPIVVEEGVTEAPEWKLKDAEGNEVSSDTLKDKAYVLHFWASWHPYAKELQAGLDGIAIGYVKKGIPTYAVSYWEKSRAKPTQDMVNRGLMLPVLEKGDQVAKEFGVIGVPTTLFIKKDGEIVHRHTDFDPNDPQIRVAYEMLADSLKE